MLAWRPRDFFCLDHKPRVRDPTPLVEDFGGSEELSSHRSMVGVKSSDLWRKLASGSVGSLLVNRLAADPTDPRWLVMGLGG